MTTPGSGDNGDLDLASLSASLSGLQFTTYLSVPPAESACPPEFADVPISELFSEIDTERQLRAEATAGESLAAGFRPRTASAPSPCGSGFESGGVLDTCVPSGGLADATTRDGRLAELDDDELIGVLRAWQRLESWCASGMLTAVAELARRRPADRTPSAAPGEFPVQLSEFISDEIAAALTLTSRTAGPGQDLGHGYGTEARAAVLELAFGQLDAAEACTEYLDGNHASEKVSRKLGYTGNGQHVVYRDDTGRTTEYRLRLDRRTWETNRGDTPCAITGIKPCLTMFGLSPSAHHDDAL